MSNHVEQIKAVEHDVTDAANLTPAELGAGIAEVGKSVEQTVVASYKKIEDGVVGAYKKIEDGAVNAYKAVEDFCVDKLFRRENETVEQAKERLQNK